MATLTPQKLEEIEAEMSRFEQEISGAPANVGSRMIIGANTFHQVQERIDHGDIPYMAPPPPPPPSNRPPGPPGPPPGPPGPHGPPGHHGPPGPSGPPGPHRPPGPQGPQGNMGYMPPPPPPPSGNRPPMFTPPQVRGPRHPPQNQGPPRGPPGPPPGGPPGGAGGPSMPRGPPPPPPMGGPGQQRQPRPGLGYGGYRPPPPPYPGGPPHMEGGNFPPGGPGPGGPPMQRPPMQRPPMQRPPLQAPPVQEKPKVVYSAAPVRNVPQLNEEEIKKMDEKIEAELGDLLGLSSSEKPSDKDDAKAGSSSDVAPGIEVNVPIEEVAAERAVHQPDMMEMYEVNVAMAAAATAKPKKDKKKKFVRSAAGTVWEDPTLAEWDNDDFRIFAGDLGNEVTDETLSRAFSKYPSFVKAKVVRDKRTNKTKGFGFVSFRDPNDFVRAMREMNGKYVGNRPIKLRKSSWKERQIDVVKKKEKEKKRLGYR